MEKDPSITEYNIGVNNGESEGKESKKKMETCKFNELIKMLEPWLDRDYMQKVFLTEHDHLVFFFTDGGQKNYCIDDCSKAQLKDILDDIKKRGIEVEKAQNQD